MTQAAAGPALPASIRVLLDGSGLRDKLSTTILLATTDREGWPNLAMLSPGEVLVVDEGPIRIALHATSGTCQALRSNGRGLLSLVADGAAYRIRVRCQHLSDPPTGGPDELFIAAVEQVTEDRVPYAKVTNGIGYELNDVYGTLRNWEAKLDRLRRLP